MRTGSLRAHHMGPLDRPKHKGQAQQMRGVCRWPGALSQACHRFSGMLWQIALSCALQANLWSQTAILDSHGTCSGSGDYPKVLPPSSSWPFGTDKVVQRTLHKAFCDLAALQRHGVALPPKGISQALHKQQNVSQ